MSYNLLFIVWYLGCFKLVFKVDQGVQLCKEVIPSSQNICSIIGLNPDVMVTLGCFDKHGNPFVDRKFQKRI